MEDIRKRRSMLIVSNVIVFVFGILVATGLVPSWLNSNFGVDIKVTITCEAVGLGTSVLFHFIAFIRFAKAVKNETGTYRFIPAFLGQIPIEEDQ